MTALEPGSHKENRAQMTAILHFVSFAMSPMISFDLVDELRGGVPIDCLAFQSKDAPLNR